MKVMHFIHGLNTGGAETLVKDYVLNIDKKKFTPVVLCLNHYKESPYEKLLKDNNINVIYVSDYMKLYRRKDVISKLINKIQRYFLVKKIIKVEQPDIIHTHLQVNKYVKFARPNKKTKLFYTMHGDPDRYKELDKKDFKSIKWLIDNYNLRIICLHSNMVEKVNKLFGINNASVLNNGINIDSFKNARDKKTMRKILNISDDSFVIGHVGRFSKVKNHDFLVNIFDCVYKNNKKAFLLMIGDGEEKERIKSILNERGLDGHYLILSNRLDIPDLLKSMDVFVFPSISEGLGISLIEAQESRLQCFISNGVPDEAIISNYVTKIDLNKDHDFWAKTIIDYKLPKRVKLNDREWDIKEVTKQLENLYLQRMGED